MESVKARKSLRRRSQPLWAHPRCGPLRQVTVSGDLANNSTTSNLARPTPGTTLPSFSSPVHAPGQRVLSRHLSFADVE